MVALVLQQITTKLTNPNQIIVIHSFSKSCFGRSSARIVFNGMGSCAQPRCSCSANTSSCEFVPAAAWWHHESASYLPKPKRSMGQWFREEHIFMCHLVARAATPFHQNMLAWCLCLQAISAVATAATTSSGCAVSVTNCWCFCSWARELCFSPETGCNLGPSTGAPPFGAREAKKAWRGTEGRIAAAVAAVLASVGIHCGSR